MNILIVNYFYPPIADAHSYRWSQIAKHWATTGSNVTVITGRVSGLPKHSIDAGVTVTRTGLIRKSATTPFDKSPKTGNGQKTVRNAIANTIRAIYRRLYWPDSAWHWLPAAGIEMFRRRNQEFDLIISYYPCFSAHIAVGLFKYIARFTKFVWIADFGDPFGTSSAMQPNNYAIYDRINLGAERALVRQADCLVMTNEDTVNTYAARLAVSSKICLIPHLVDLDKIYAEKSPLKDCAARPTILTYVGGFHRAVRKPDRLIELIKKLNERDRGSVLLKIYGPLNGFHASELSPPGMDYIQYFGPVSREAAISLIKKAEFLVNVDNEERAMTPSKIVEYIGTGNPIINISNDSVRYAPLDSYANEGFAISLKEENYSVAELNRVASFLWRHKGSSGAPLNLVRNILAPHRLQAVSDRYLELMGELGRR